MIFDELMKYGTDAPPWIVDHEPIAMETDDGEVRPHVVADRVARIASALRARGLRPGERCLVWLDSPTDITMAYIATTAIDAVPVLISPLLPASTVEAMVEGVPGITSVLSADDRLAALSAALPAFAPLDWREIAAEAPRHKRFTRPPAVGTDSTYVIVHTSGTTNIPKLLECSGRSIEVNAQVQAFMHWASRLKGYLAAQLSAVHGRTVVGVYAAFKRKAPLIVLQHESPEKVAEILSRYRPEYLETHPNTFRAWQHLAADGVFSSVRFFGSGFDVIHPDTVQTLLRGSSRRLPFFVELYGQNEAGPISVTAHFRALARAPRRRSPKALTGHPVGFRIPMCRIRILDELGRPVRRGTPGRIVVKTPGAHAGYINTPHMVSRDYPKGRWWDTGDWGKKSLLGTLTLVDRATDKVTLGASAIAMEDELLARFSQLLELVIVEQDGELVPIGSIRPGCEITDEAWAEATRDFEHLGRLRVIPDEQFPRTATGKIQRGQLKAQLVGAH